jgi:hypothetical protein
MVQPSSVPWLRIWGRLLLQCMDLQRQIWSGVRGGIEGRGRRGARAKVRAGKQRVLLAKVAYSRSNPPLTSGLIFPGLIKALPRPPLLPLLRFKSSAFPLPPPPPRSIPIVPSVLFCPISSVLTVQSILCLMLRPHHGELQMSKDSGQPPG